MRVSLSALLLFIPSCATTPPLEPAIRARIDELARSALGTGKHMGLAVGILKDGRSEVFGYGRLSTEVQTPPDGSSVFEIGSITKAFTGILLAQMVAEGKLALEDPIKKHLPESVPAPSREGKQITLLQLATHTSGLPRLPSNFLPKDPLNPYAHYSLPNLYKFLETHTLRRDPGAQYEYSNVGIGLLGHILELKGGKSYEELVVERICTPLKMNDTRIALSDNLRRRLAPGHLPNGKTVPNWDLPTLAGAGALRSSVNDMLRFLSANLDARYEAAHVPRFDVDKGGTRIGLGWHLSPYDPKAERMIVWHNGGTGGYRTIAAFVRETRSAVVVLGNSSESVDALGMAILMTLHDPGGVKKE